MKGKVKIGFRYELEYKGEIVGLWGYYDLHALAVNNNKYKETAILEQRLNVAHDVGISWLHTSQATGKHYFTYKGYKRIQAYIKGLRKVYRQYGIKINLSYIYETDYIWKDENQLVYSWS